MTFEEMFEKYYVNLRHYAYTLLKDKEVSSSVTLGAFMTLYQQWAEFKAESNMKAFLFTIVRNSCYNKLKEQKSQRKKDKELGYLFDETYAEKDLEAEMVYENVLTSVYAAIETLPTKCKVIFKMRYFEQKKIPVIATILKIAINTVRSQLVKARGILKLKAFFS